MSKHNFHIVLLALIVGSLLYLTACSGRKNTDASPETPLDPSSGQSAEKTEAGIYTKITAEEAYEMMQNQEVIVVDVRTQAEYNEGYIPKAILIPNEEIEENPPELLPDLEATILVYCRSGNRSAQAAKKLIKMGYTKVYDFGGINKWTYGVEKP